MGTDCRRNDIQRWNRWQAERYKGMVTVGRRYDIHRWELMAYDSKKKWELTKGDTI